MKIVKLYKKAGETPLECLNRFLGDEGINRGSAEAMGWSYLGRLDPLAEGVLLVGKDLSEEKREEVLSLRKVYEFEVLYGVETDTADILGIIKNFKIVENIQLPKPEKHLGSLEQKYPAFSSKTILGKPMHFYARAGAMPESLPTKKVTLFDLKFKNRRKLLAKELLKEVEMRISKVTGDFRQNEILKKWKEKILRTDDFFILDNFVCEVSSGFYVRQLCERLGTEANCPALAYSIKRIRVGDYSI